MTDTPTNVNELDEMRAETIWQAESMRAAKHSRRELWVDVDPGLRDDYRFIARAIREADNANGIASVPAEVTTAMSEMLTKEEFAALTPRQKGYAVYMAGNRADQPNIPSEYTPEPGDKREYEAGQFEGVLEAQDCDD